LLIIITFFFASGTSSGTANAACGDTITSDTTLTGNLNCAGNGLIIGANNINLDCNGHSIIYSNSVQGVGVFANTRNNITIKNCNISQGNPSFEFAYGIQLEVTHNSFVVNNTVTTSYAFNSYGIAIAGSNNTIHANTVKLPVSLAITLGGSGNNITANNVESRIYIRPLSNGNIVAENNITNVSANAIGISITNGRNNIVRGNTITGLGTNTTFPGMGIFITSETDFPDSAEQNIIIGNNIINTYPGIRLEGSVEVFGGFIKIARNNSIISNQIIPYGGGSGISFYYATDNSVISNIVRSSGPGIAVGFASEKNTLISNRISSNTSYISIGATGTSSTNTTFEQESSSVRFIPTITLPSTISTADLNLTFNRVFLKSSTLSFLNTSAEITLRNITFAIPQPLVDLEDDGSFEVCNPPQCHEISYSNGIFVFNVSSFTTYSSNQSAANPISTCNDNPNVTGTWIVTQNLASNGTCLNILSNDIVLDCNGFYLTGNSTKTGINATGRNNVTIKNCIVQNFSSGILLSGTNSSFLLNNTAKSGAGSAIHLVTNSNNNMLIDNSGSSVSSSGIQLTSSYGNTLTRNRAFSENNIALHFVYASNNVFDNNTISGGPFSAIGIHFGAGFNNTFTNTEIIFNGSPGGVAINFNFGSENNSFNGTIIESNGLWFGNTGNNTMENTEFRAGNGSIRIIPSVIVPVAAFAGKPELNITYNRAFLNSSFLPFFNTTAEITLHGINFSNPKAIADFDDDGVFGDCPATICTELSFSNGTFVYSVTHFTAYSSNETVSLSCGQTITSNTLLGADLNCSGNGLSIGSNSVVLDCNGYSIRGDATGNGIENNGYNNVVIKNCNVQNFINGIILSNANSNVLQNNTANSNALGIVLSNSSNNNITQNRARFNSDSGIQLITYSRDNILSGNDFTNNNIRSVYLFPDIASRFFECHNTILDSNIGGNRGKPVLYHHDTSNVVVKDRPDFYGQIIFCNVTNSVIENVSVIDGSAIELFNSHNNTLDWISLVSNRGVGSQILYSHNNTIKNSEFLFAADDNIYLCGSNHNTIENSTFRGSGRGGHEGVHIYEASSNNVIRNNNIQFQSISGIAINDYTTVNSNGCTLGGAGANNVITGNTIANNGINLSVGTFGDGITLGGVDFTTVTNNLIINNVHSGINMFGNGITFSSDGNTVSGNTILNNNRAGVGQVAGISVGGIGITSSNMESVSSNTVCYNTNLDFNLQNSALNTGNLNTCNSPDGWDDGVIPPGCTFFCLPQPTCATPYDDFYISANTQICPGLYNIPDSFLPGAVIINANNVVLDCSNATFTGNGNGIGILNPGFNNVTIRNCNVQNYQAGISLENSVSNNVSSNMICSNLQDLSLANASGAGTGNTCDTSDGWNDQGTTGCTFLCTPATGVNTSTGTGTANFTTNYGKLMNLTAVNESSLPAQGKPNVSFPHGLFSFNITGLLQGQKVTVKITYPSSVSNTTQYWKFGPTPGNSTPHWYQIPVGSNDGDNVITINITDGGLGDHDLTANGVIADPGGIANTFICGDVNNDGKVNLSDIIYLVNYIFKGGPAPIPLQAGDVNKNGQVNLADIVYLVNYIFKGGPKPCA